MCDDYFDDESCEGCDSENGSEDFLDEPFNEEVDCDECEDFEETDEEDAYMSEPAEEEVLPTLNMVDAVILGSMITGNAYQEAVNEKSRLKMLRSNDKPGVFRVLCQG